jgi:SAM-dependent methyltransferase
MTTAGPCAWIPGLPLRWHLQGEPRVNEETYPFSSSEAERKRLIAQDGLMAASAQRLFEKPGITSGMRVLDIGSGAGDVAFLAARLVGRRGDCDRDRSRSGANGIRRAAGKSSRSDQRPLITGDFREVELSPAVDAIVGRMVLMHAKNPLEALCSVVGLDITGKVVLRRRMDAGRGRMVSLIHDVTGTSRPVAQAHSLNRC